MNQGNENVSSGRFALVANESKTMEEPPKRLTTSSWLLCLAYPFGSEALNLW